MSTTTTPPMTAAPSTWLRERPRSWGGWVLGVALTSLYPAVIVLVFGLRPRTAAGWAMLAVGAFTVQAVSERFRNPVFDNALARRLATRTDQNASGVRVLYMLGALALWGLVVTAVLVALSFAVAPLAPFLRAFSERHFY